SATNNSNRDSPVITSGMTSGAVVMPNSRVRPRNWPKRARVTPARGPSTTAQQAEIAAIWIDSPAAPRIGPYDSSYPYQRKVGECGASHTVTRRELLNENTISDTIGTYRNT